MADHTAVTIGPSPAAPWAEWRRRAGRFAGAISPGANLGPVKYTPAVVATFCCIAAAALTVGIAAIRLPTDVATLAMGSVTVFCMAVFAVRSILPVQTNWSTSTFIHLGLAFTLGPIGVAASAVAEALGSAIRTRNGWFRTAFNASNHFISGVGAYIVFAHVHVLLGSGVVSAPVAGIAAASAYFALNNGFIALIVHAADPTVESLSVLRKCLSILPYDVGFGWSAFAFVVLHDQAGVIGDSALVMPVVLLQGALLAFARRVRVFDEQRAAHQREREALLHKAVEASETERRRIARDLHDGVVQNLSGMAFAMTAASSRLKASRTADGDSDLLELLDHSAKETRQAMKDLRTLIIEIAPPTLRREGLHAALLEILSTLEQAGTRTRLELPSNMRLRQDRASLIFRVAQEVLRNVAAHAEAASVSVILREQDGMAVLRIEDDGRGFTQADVSRRRAKGHVGTNAIVELAEDAGGSLSIDSHPGKGTRVVLKLPVE